jgi:hypothetical protein
MPNNYFLKALTVSSLGIFIVGCNKTPTFTGLCAINPRICKEFHEDSWCKQERITVGFAHTRTSGDIQKSNQLISYEIMLNVWGIHLKFNEKNQLETPELQLNLANYYTKKDPNKTLSLLYHVLELTTMNDPINNEVFKSITTLFADKKNIYGLKF